MGGDIKRFTDAERIQCRELGICLECRQQPPETGQGSFCHGCKERRKEISRLRARVDPLNAASLQFRLDRDIQDRRNKPAANNRNNTLEARQAAARKAAGIE